jgi:nucleoside-diphosphate-sugar epimerase
VIPAIILQLLAGEGASHLGALDPTRDLTYVSDTCAGFIEVGSCDAAVGRDVNLGSGREISVGGLAVLLMEIVGVELPVVCDQERLRPAASEVERLLSDNSLAADLAGWRPRLALREGITRTFEWLADPSHRAGYRLRYTV